MSAAYMSLKAPFTTKVSEKRSNPKRGAKKAEKRGSAYTVPIVINKPIDPEAAPHGQLSENVRNSLLLDATQGRVSRRQPRCKSIARMVLGGG